MSMQKDNNFWYKYFQSFKAYLKSDKYPLNETKTIVIELVDNIVDINSSVIGNYYVRADHTIYDQDSILVLSLNENDLFVYDSIVYILNDLFEESKLTVLDIVDYKTDPVDNENLPSYINVNTVGYSFVKDDNTIYDNELNLIQVLTVGDTFLIDDTTFFINSEENVYEFNNQWNNSLLGDNGISLVIGGGFDIKEDTDLNLWTAPQISFVFEEVFDVDALERNATTEVKTFNYDIDIFVHETDSYNSTDSTGYDELNRVDSLLNFWIYDYFNTKKCAHDLDNISYVGHKYGLKKYLEDRPSLVAIKSNLITFR